MHYSIKKALAILAMLSVPGGAYAAGAVDSYPSTKDTYLDGKDNKDLNFGNSTSLTISKDLKSTALLGFNLDNTFNFPTNDCNLTKDIAKAELVLNVLSASDCQGGECQLELRMTDDFQEGNGSSGAGPTWHCENDSNIANTSKDCAASWSGGNVGPKIVENITVPSGFSGALKIPITSYVQDLDSGTLISNLMLVSKNHGDVVISSKEGASAPHIEVTQPDLKDNESEISEITRKTLEVNGINMSYLEAGDPNSSNQFLLIHGIPSYSYMYRNVMPRLAEQGHVIAVDWVGVGQSERAPLEEFDYKFTSQASQLADFVSGVGMTSGDRQIIMMIHEVGGLGAFHYAVTHQADVKGIAFAETWIDVCPPAQEGIACSSKSLVFTPDLLAAWQYVVYPDTSLQYPGTHPWTGACGLIRNFATPAALQYGVTVRGISSQVVQNYESVIGCQYDLNNPTDASCPNDPICDLDFGLAQFPKNIPVQVPGEPAYSRELYDNYVATLKGWSVPKLMAYGDPGAVVNNIGMVFQAQVNYPEITTSCIGKAGHFAPEDAPINLARRILEWANDEGLLE